MYVAVINNDSVYMLNNSLNLLAFIKLIKNKNHERKTYCFFNID